MGLGSASNTTLSPDDDPSHHFGDRRFLVQTGIRRERQSLIYACKLFQISAHDCVTTNSPRDIAASVPYSALSRAQTSATFVGLGPSRCTAHRPRFPHCKRHPIQIPPQSSPPTQVPFVLDDRPRDSRYPARNPSLPGGPALSNVRMTMTVAPANTTIRLVTTPFFSTSSALDIPQKLPFKTSVDIVLRSPKSTAPKWPALRLSIPSLTMTPFPPLNPPGKHPPRTMFFRRTSPTSSLPCQERRLQVNCSPRLPQARNHSCSVLRFQ